MSLTLSDRTYPMLREFIDRSYNFVMSIEDAQMFDQRPFRSMLVRRYVRYKPAWTDNVGYHRGGFVVTEDGRKAYSRFHEADKIARKPAQQHRPLTRYFDPAAFGLTPEKLEAARARRKIRIVGAA